MGRGGEGVGGGVGGGGGDVGKAKGGGKEGEGKQGVGKLALKHTLNGVIIIHRIDRHTITVMRDVITTAEIYDNRFLARHGARSRSRPYATRTRAMRGIRMRLAMLPPRGRPSL